MQLTTNPPSAPKPGKKSARKWDARVRGIIPSKVVDFWLASFVQSRPLHPGAVEKSLKSFGRANREVESGQRRDRSCDRNCGEATATALFMQGASHGS